MSVRLSKFLIIGMLLAIVTASFNLRPLSRSHAQDPQNPPTQKIESDDARVVQSGAWSTQPATNASAGTYLFSSGSEADVLTLEFAGAALEILYIAGPSLGTLAIEVDGTVLRTVITADSETRYGQSAKINYLTDEPHTLKVYAQARGVIAIDAFSITPLTEDAGEVKNVESQPVNLSNCPAVDTAIQQISVGVGGNVAFGASYRPDISADGRFIVFWSNANNLVVGDTPNSPDVFLWDRQTCALTRYAVPPPSTSTTLLYPSFLGISDDGNYVVYTYGYGPGIPMHCPPGFPQCNEPFYTTTIHNRTSSTNTQIGPMRSITPTVLSGDRYLVLPNYDVSHNLRVVDITTNTSTDIVVGPTGSSFYKPYDITLSADGRYIGFRVQGTAMAIPDCMTTDIQVFVHDRQTQTTNCVARASDGTLANDDVTSRPYFSANGRYIAFKSAATNLVPNDLNNENDIFVRDLQTNQTERITNSSDGFTQLVDFSADGRSVIYYVGRTGPNVTYIRTLYMVDRQNQWTTSIVTHSTNTVSGPDAKLTADGRLVAFSSEISLAAGDTNALNDIFTMSGVAATQPAPSDTLALFNPVLNEVRLMATLQDLVPTAIVYTTNAPAEAANGRWVTGDWDGNGEATPGVYAPNGVFYYTNEIGASTTWSSIWVGLLGRPPVAGRFDAGVNHDCIGAVDGANFPPHGTAFALYFTCDLTDGTAPALNFQWLSVLLPDAGGFSGTHQFAAGDFNNDGVDSIAVRRGEFISFGNIPPTTLLSEFNLAQYWGVPPVTDSEAGIFLAGDFDNTAGDSFGVFYQNGHFYYRNSVEWSPAGHLLQRVGQPIGTPVQATSWR